MDRPTRMFPTSGATPASERALQKHGDVYGNFFPRRLLGKTQQVGDQIASSPGLVHDLAHQRILFVGEPFLRPELLRITHDRGQRVVDVVRRSRHQVAEGSQFFSLHQFALQTLLTLVSPARLLQQSHQRLVLDILPQEHECPQHQHRNQHGGNPEYPRRSGRLVKQYSPQPQHWQRQERQHRQSRNHFLPPRVQADLAALQIPFPRR